MQTKKITSVSQLLFAPVGCPNIFPGTPQQNQLLRTEMYYYAAIANGATRHFTDQDRLLEYDSSVIMDPDQVSYINLFINGMLQPPILYEVRRGILLLKSTDVPQAGVLVMLQFVKILLPLE